MTDRKRRFAYILCLLWALALCGAALAEGGSLEAPAAEQGPVALAEGYDLESLPVAAEMSAATDFPDDVFREYVLNRFDTNHDGEISSSEAKKVKTIDVSGMGISSLKGIEKFGKLTALNCADNDIEALDLSGNKSLEKLFCHDNPIEALEIGKCSKLVKTAKSVFPEALDGAVVFQKKKSGKVETLLALPEDAALFIKGAAFFDPAAGFALLDDEVLMTEKQKVNLLAEDCGYPAAYCSFAVSNKSVLKLSGGVVTASKAGEATVVVTTFDGQSESCDFVVMKAPSKVTLSDKKLSLSAGEEYLLEAEVPEYSVATYTWSSSRSSVASVDGDGLVTARGAGKATITVKTQNGKKASCAVTVSAAPTSITLDVDRLGMMPGQTHALKVTLNKGAGGIVTLYSDAPAIADVDDDTGVITAFSEGTTTIWAETFNGLRAGCVVSVMPGPSTIILDEKLSIGVGESGDLEALALTAEGEDVSQMLSYKSSDEKTVSVTAAGVIKGLKAGTATITASAPNGVKAACKVTVSKAVTSISLNKKELTLKYDRAKGQGETFRLKATLNSGAVAEVDFMSDDEDVAVVDDDGLVTAVGVGWANIIAETENGLRAECVVTVNAASVTPAPADDPTFDYDDVIVVAHRGGLSCGPENTLEAFSNSASTGADMIELDVRTTKDGVQVINHDAKISGKKIKDKKYSELLKYKPDLCTLDDALDVIYDSGLLLQVELKDTADVTKTVNAVRAHGMEDRVIYISFEKDLLRKVRKLDADARLGFIFMDSVPSGLDSFINELDICALMVHWKLLTQSRLDSWHAQGLKVNVWTIDNYNECVSWIRMGVDYITSNYPEVAVRARGD